MLESIITFLIYICVLALVIYLIIWVLRDVLGVPIPGMVIRILWVIVALLAILYLVRLVLPGLGGKRLLGALEYLAPLVT